MEAEESALLRELQSGPNLLDFLDEREIQTEPHILSLLYRIFLLSKAFSRLTAESKSRSLFVL